MKVCLYLKTKYAFILNMSIEEDRIIIEDLGGPSKIANDLCGGDITPQAVSQWKSKGIPDGWRKYLRLLRPAIFDRHVSVRAVPANQGAAAA